MDYTIEPELLSPVPRLTRHRSRSSRIAAYLYRFALVFLIGMGLLMFVYFCLQLTLGNTRPIEGRITTIKLPESSSNRLPDNPTEAAKTARNAISPRVPMVEYTFEVDGKAVEGSFTIMPDQIKLLPPGGAIRVRCLPYLLDLGNRPILPNDTFWGWVGILGVVTLLTNVVIGTLCWFTFVLSRTQRDLCRYGRTAVGTVIRKEAVGSGAPTYIVHYRFEPRPDKIDGFSVKPTKAEMKDRKTITEALGEMRVPREFWEDLDEGDRLTVLYSEHNPDVNMLYLPGSYAVVPQTYAVVTMREDSRVNR